MFRADTFENEGPVVRGLIGLCLHAESERMKTHGDGSLVFAYCVWLTVMFLTGLMTLLISGGGCGRAPGTAAAQIGQTWALTPSWPLRHIHRL